MDKVREDVALKVMKAPKIKTSLGLSPDMKKRSAHGTSGAKMEQKRTRMTKHY